jgi:drug/metabolite transporter (DMT)-like permease
MTHSGGLSAPATWRLLAAFAAVYLIWGSTYLGIRLAIETLPPFLMAGGRFVIAGLLLYGWARMRGAPAPTRLHWRSTAIIGGLLLLGGNGLVTWAEQEVPSGLAALIVAVVPLWIVLLEWLRSGERPGLPVLSGVVIGLAGIALLVSPNTEAGAVVIAPIGILALLTATLCWANGSLYSRRAPLPSSPLLATGMEMLWGGVLLTLVGTATGEWARLDLSAISLTSLLAFAYLTVFGSIIAFTAYVWLLKATTPARAATYAYVNPVVAVFLGWALAGEAITARTLMAAAVIIGAVILITTYRSAVKREPAPEAVVSRQPPAKDGMAAKANWLSVDS